MLVALGHCPGSSGSIGLALDNMKRNVLYMYFKTNQEPMVKRYESRYEKTGFLHMRKQTAFCICENKNADQLRGNREADQRLCFRYTDSTIPLLPKSEISSL